MGSGTFPLHHNDEDGKKLLEAARLIGEVHSSMADGVFSGDSGGGQYDNAASDGGSLALLSLAKSLVEGGVRIPDAKP
jgi:hypothetical protein